MVLAAIGLAVAGAVTYRQTRADLLARVDHQINSAAERPELFFPEFNHSPDPKLTGAFLPPGTWAQVRAASTGDILGTKGVLTKADLTLPKTIKPGSAFTLGDPHYRVRAAQPTVYELAVGQRVIPVQAFLIVAIPLADVDQTLHHLFLVEVVVALAVLSALALLAWWVVKLGLRPLEHMQQTAGAIAAGDLSRRVDVVDEHTEVGRLGIALNEMMQQIETAFAARRVGRTAAPLRRRRVARAANAAHLDPRLRRAVPARRRRSGRPRQGDAPDRGRGGPHGLARRRHVAARAPRPGAPARTTSPSTSRASPATRSTTRAVAPNRPIDYSPNGAIFVPGDEARLRQVLANLLQNANRHTPPGTPVHVQVVDGDDEAVIEVADEGPGMPSDDASRVFERFWRSDPSRTRASGGAGLGLAIVAAIADAHGGRAEVSQQPGQGSTFRVHLPKPERPRPAADDRVRSQRRPAPEPTNLVDPRHPLPRPHDPESPVTELVRRGPMTS